MNTRFITAHEFTRTASGLARRAKKQKEQVILQSKNAFFFKLLPMTKKELFHEMEKAKLQKALEDVKAGRTFTLKEVEKHLNIV